MPGNENEPERPEQITADLNPEQKEAVTAPLGPLLVLAGPGSGKTRILVNRAAWLVESGQARPRDILAITFTNKAADEMRERLSDILGDGASEMFIGTFHAFSLRLLRKYREAAGLSRDFAILDETGQRAFVRQAVEELNYSLELYPPHEVIDFIASRKEKLQSPDYLSPEDANDPLAKHKTELALRYQEFLRSQKLLDFDDLIVRAVKLLRESPSVRTKLQSRFRHILVDEFHDINLAQYELLRALAAPGWDISIVADDDQSIYGWRGADTGLIGRFRSRYKPKVVELQHNYRSTSTILYASQELIRHNSRRGRRKFMHTDRSENHPIYHYHASTEKSEFLVVKQLIGNLHRSGHRYSDIAILYRTHRLADSLEQALLADGIPVQRVQPEPLWRAELQPIRSLLRLLIHPDPLAVLEAANFPQVVLDELTQARLFGANLADPHSADGLPPLTKYTLRAFWAGVSDLRGRAEEGPEVTIPLAFNWLRRRLPPWTAAEGIPNLETSPLAKEAAGILVEASERGETIRIPAGPGLPGEATRAIFRGTASIVGVGVSHDEGYLLPSISPAQAILAVKEALIAMEKVGEGEFIVYDLETTGNDPRRDEIVEIGAIRLRNRQEAARFHTLVKPRRPISREAQAVHGINWRMLADAPRIEDVLPRFIDFIGSSPVVGHNVRAFDHRILDRESGRLLERGFHPPTVDTLVLAKHVWPNEPSYALERLLSRLGMDEPVRHRALDDVRQEASLFFHLWYAMRDKQAWLALAPWLPLAAVGLEGENNALLTGAARIRQRQAQAPMVGAWLESLSPDDQWNAISWERALGQASDPDEALLRAQEDSIRDLLEQFRAGNPEDTSLAAFLDYLYLQTDLDRYDPEADKVVMMTLHNAKGTEFPVVIITGLEQGNLPIWRAVGQEDLLAEERRVFYVGMTRAKERLYLVSVHLRADGRERPPSQFLQEIPKKYIQPVSVGK